MRSTLSICAALLAIGSSQAQASELFHDDFESGTNLSSPLPSGYGWNGTNSGSADAVGVSADIAHSGTHSVKFTFGGNADLADDAWSELRYVLGYNMNEVYMQWYVYYPDGTEGLGPKWQHRMVSPNNNKFYKLWADSYTNYTVATGVSTHALENQCDLYFVEYGTNQGLPVAGHGASADFSGTDERLGRWLKIQIRTKTATAANNDGAIQMWIDDVMVLNDTALPLYPSGGAGNYLRNGYLMGWMNSGFAETSSMYIDDVTIADAPIGTVGPRAPNNLQVH